MGKLRPIGHIRPVRLFNPSRRTCPNYSKNRIHLAFFLQCPTGVSPLDGPAGVSPLDGPAGVSPLDGPAGVSPLDGPAGVSPLDGPAGVSPLDGALQTIELRWILG